MSSVAAAASVDAAAAVAPMPRKDDGLLLPNDEVFNMEMLSLSQIASHCGFQAGGATARAFELKVQERFEDLRIRQVCTSRMPGQEWHFVPDVEIPIEEAWEALVPVSEATKVDLARRCSKRCGITEQAAFLQSKDALLLLLMPPDEGEVVRKRPAGRVLKRPAAASSR